MLTRLNRLRAFEIARYAFAKSGGDFKKAKDIADGEARKLGLDPVMISLILQVVLFFLKKWMDNQEAAMLGSDSVEVPVEFTEEVDAEICQAFPQEANPNTP